MTRLEARALYNLESIATKIDRLTEQEFEELVDIVSDYEVGYISRRVLHNRCTRYGVNGTEALVYMVMLLRK